MKNVIGLGYIELPIVLMFAKSGIKLVGSDVNNKLVDSLTKGNLSFDLKKDLKNHSVALPKEIQFTTDYHKALTPCRCSNTIS